MNGRLWNTVATIATCVTLVTVSAPGPVQAQKARRRAQPAADQAAPPAAGATQAPTLEAGAPASKTLENALKLYDSEDYYMSSIELDKVVDHKTGDDESNVQRAEFFMGKTLFNLKFYSASLSYFSKIVDKGPTHRYYNKTLQWLASLSRFLPESAGVLEKIGKYNRQDLEQEALKPVRDELYYLLGRFHYTKGNFKDALELFGQVPLQSEFFNRAKFLEGMTYVRQYDGKQASQSFREILRKSREAPDKTSEEYTELANLSLARVFYSTKQYDLSIKYYNKISNESGNWLPALFESSWSRFQTDEYSWALGNIHTLNAPFFENEFFPESLILKAVIFFRTCNYDRSMETLVEFNQVYPELRKDIEELVKKYPADDDFYNYVQKIRAGEAGLKERLQRAVEGALLDKTLAKSLDYVSELDRELKQVDKADPNWKSTQIAGTVLQDLTLQRSLAANEAGKLAKERLKRLAGEIQELMKQALKVEYETLAGQKGQLEAAIRGEQLQVSDKARKAEVIVTDDEHYVWPFRGEYWKDELGYYRFKIRNRCEQQKGAAAISGAAP